MSRLFRLDGKGSGLALGPLETRAIEVVWQLGGWVTVSDVYDRLILKHREFAYSTIKTILNNLVDKGHLCKRAAGRANEFKAVRSKEAFDERLVRDVVEPLLAHHRNPLLAHIVHELDDEEGVAELERLLAQKKAKARLG